MRRPILITAGGACIELVVLLQMMPQDSTAPPTSFQRALLITQTPGVIVGRVFETLDLDRLPQPLALFSALVAILTEFALEAGLFAVAIWLALRWWSVALNRVSRPTVRASCGADCR